MAARADQVAEPGAFVAVHLLDQPVVVVRGADRVLRAFYNVCRHHAGPVAAGSGCAERLVCRYHAWTYDLDGRLRSAPRMGAVEGFDRDAMGLVPLPVAAWGPLVFVHLGGGEPAPSGVFDALPPELRGDGLVHAARRVYEMGCNWKVYVDNYLDGGYHVAHLHRGLAAELDLKRYTTEVFARHSIQRCTGVESDGSRGGSEALYAWIHPNLMLNRYGQWLDSNVVYPLAADRTRVVFDYWVAPEVARDATFDASLRTSQQIQDEDTDICEAVQRGLASDAYDAGRYAPAVEVGEHHFHRLLAAEVG